MERRIKGVLSPKASGSITITENGNYDVVDVANAIVNVVLEEVGGITPEGSITLTSNGVYDVTMYAEVVVDVENVIPEGYVKPSGTLNVTSNGTFDVTEKKNVSVNVPQPSGTIEITENGVVDVTNYANANVNIATSGYTLKEALRELINVKLNGSIPSLAGLFTYFNGDITTFVDKDLLESNIDLFYVFQKAKFTKKIPDFSVYPKSSGQYNYFFYDYYGTSEFLPSLTFSSNKVYLYNMFENAKQITTIPKWYFNNVTTLNLAKTFKNCLKLIEVPDWDYSKLTSLDEAFYGCEELENGLERLSNCENLVVFKYAFTNCKNLIEVPVLPTQKVSDFTYAFNSCSSLTTIKGIDLLKATTTNSMLSYCNNLTNLTLYNIKCATQIASGTSWGHLITKESLIQIIGELIDTGSSKKLTMGSANLSKLADVYVKITSTDADENGNVKLPFEVCNASDSGAMLITNYVTQKNWSLA